MLWWIATVSVLRHYSEKSITKKQVAFSIPLVYFLIQFEPLFLNLFSSVLTSDPVIFSSIYIITFNLSKPIGGILFSISFWAIARKIDYNNTVRNYIIISAYGVLLIFVSNQASVLTNGAYPPFGLATTSFMGLASYLVLVGISSSAISISQDVRLRRSIRDLTTKQVKLLDSIGTAQMEQDILRKVVTVVKENQNSLIEETGVEPSMTEQDMKQYLEDVLKEIKSGKMK